MNDVNNRIRYIRTNVGLSQTEFAKKIGLSKNFISLVETGGRIPGDRTLKDICREFNVNEVWLRSGIGKPFKAVSRADEISAFIGKVLGNDGTPIQQACITVLARTTPDEWALFESKLLEIAGEVKSIKKETDQ